MMGIHFTVSGHDPTLGIDDYLRIEYPALSLLCQTEGDMDLITASQIGNQSGCHSRNRFGDRSK